MTEQRIKTSKVGAIGGVVCSIVLMVAAIVNNHPYIRTSEAGLLIIGDAEGCRRDPYMCPSSVLTVGIGSTAAGGDLIDPTRLYTDEEIAERWAKDLAIAERCVNRHANGWSLPQGAFDAAVSLTFNVGCGAVQRSTFFKKLRADDIPGACHELSRWVYSGGKKLRGLELRRDKEKALCLAG